MHTVVRHIVLPLSASAALVALYYTPATVIGCVTRGLLALGIALAAAAAAFIVLGLSLRDARRGVASARLRLITAALLILPLALLLGPLG